MERTFLTIEETGTERVGGAREPLYQIMAMHIVRIISTAFDKYQCILPFYRQLSQSLYSWLGIHTKAFYIPPCPEKPRKSTLRCAVRIAICFLQGSRQCTPHSALHKWALLKLIGVARVANRSMWSVAVSMPMPLTQVIRVHDAIGPEY